MDLLERLAVGRVMTVKAIASGQDHGLPHHQAFASTIFGAERHSSCMGFLPALSSNEVVPASRCAPWSQRHGTSDASASNDGMAIVGG